MRSAVPRAVPRTNAQSRRAPNTAGVWWNRSRRYRQHRMQRAAIAATVYARARHQKIRYRIKKDNPVQKSGVPQKSRTSRGWYWLLLLPYLAILWLPSFNRIEPRAFGIPFFYWYQLVLVVLSTFVIAVV